MEKQAVLFELGLRIYDPEFMNIFAADLHKRGFKVYFSYPLISCISYKIQRVDDGAIVGYINPQFKNKTSDLHGRKRLISFDETLDNCLERYDLEYSVVEENIAKQVY